ncbi:MAG: flagellar biosynthetic protein FliR [Sandaracinaceae bacterium]|nr:flagellar biosynthetic protein FliR [Sandaracinaceae bacterium]
MTLPEALLGSDPAAAATVLALVLARTLPLAFVAPWLGLRGTALFARVAAALVIALALAPLARAVSPALPEGVAPLALALVREALVGAAFAIALSAPLYALLWTGSLIDRWRGSPPDATAASAGSPLGQLHLGAGVVLFVLLGGHRLALAAFAGGLVDLPAGAPASAVSLGQLALGAMRIVADALVLSVAFLAPAAIAFVLVELAFGLAARVAPAVSGWMEAMPLRAALGVALALFGLSALVGRLGPVFARSIETATDLLRAP